MCAQESIESRIERTLETVRPYLQKDGGDVRFVRVRDNGTLEVQWLGTCQRCPVSLMTLRAGVERTVLREIPEITRVEAVGG
ncbi:MAG TPA: NifU family protein [Bacteroidota bacterium]|nr:NifU family protein [Bacteroidota bacterium]